jgi:hypothetical protein
LLHWLDDLGRGNRNWERIFLKKKKKLKGDDEKKELAL